MRYFCKSCNFRYTPKGQRLHKICPACGKETLMKDYDAATILSEVSKDQFLI